MYYNPKGLVYSLDEKIFVSHLKKGDFCVDNYDFSGIEKYLKDNKISIMLEDQFPPRLTNFENFPYIIYCKGNIDLLNSKKIVGVVGPRKPSSYGLCVLDDLFSKLKNYDIVTVSGMAPGVDSHCHTLSMRYGIPTISVLGGGLDYFLNSDQRDMIENITKNGGLILSEFKLKQHPLKYTFPMRNRIIAGLCDILVVPEAGIKSGSLITVDFANEFGRPVYGFPAGIYTPNAMGLNEYFDQGKATPIFNIKSFMKIITDNFLNEPIEDIRLPDLTEQEKILMNIISQSEHTNIDILLDSCEFDFQLILSLITSLEMKGLITQIFPGTYKLNLQLS